MAVRGHKMLWVVAEYGFRERVYAGCLKICGWFLQSTVWVIGLSQLWVVWVMTESTVQPIIRLG